MNTIFQSVNKNKFLIVELLKQNLFTQYKQSKFSLFWIVFNPFFQILIWTILHYSGFLYVGNVQMPYVIYLIAGIVLWWYTYNIYDSVSTLYIKYSGIILENQFDIAVLVIEAWLRQSIFFIIHLVVLLIFSIYFKISFQPLTLVYPILLIPLILFALSLGLIFAVWRILAVDFAMIFDKMINLLFFITPILYKPNFNNQYLKYIIKFNPFSYLITLPRNAMIYGTLPNNIQIILLFVGTSIVFYLSIIYFKRMKFKTIEKILQ